MQVNALLLVALYASIVDISKHANRWLDSVLLNFRGDLADLLIFTLDLDRRLVMNLI